MRVWSPDRLHRLTDTFQTLRRNYRRNEMNFATVTRTLTATAALLLGAQAFAQDTVETAVQGQVCAGQRYNDLGGAQTTLGCVANDLVVTTSSTLNANTVQQCPINTQSTVSLLVTIQSSSTDRYNVGYFVGENGNASNSNVGTCSIATFPTSPTGTHISGGKWYSDDGNACGDYNKQSTSTNQVDNVKVLCQGDANGNLVIPYTLVYGNTGGTCTGTSNVNAGTQSKCQTGTTPVSNVFVTTDANPSCTKEFSGLGGDVLTTTIVISNNDPNHNQAADGTTFEDNFNLNTPVLTVLTANCVPSGGAACTVNNNSGDVTGTIGTFPFGSSVTVTITAATNPGDTSAYSNDASLTTPPTVLPPAGSGWVLDPATGTSTLSPACSAQTTLPVKLQKFDVK